MEAKALIYVPYAFRTFQGFSVVDIKESVATSEMEIVLLGNPDRQCLCNRCNGPLGAKKDQYRVKARHLKCFGWNVSVTFYREKRYCPLCEKVRSELIDWICPTSPHMTMELSWWINRMSEVTSVLAVSRLQ